MIIEKAKFDGITTFILGGLALEYCLGEAAYDLYDAGFQVIVNLSATKAIGDADAWIRKARDYGIKFVESSKNL
jgi:nicotinamidase/pyrazinamidase